jgi:hypothetical protein
LGERHTSQKEGIFYLPKQFYRQRLAAFEGSSSMAVAKLGLQNSEDYTEASAVGADEMSYVLHFNL